MSITKVSTKITFLGPHHSIQHSSLFLAYSIKREPLTYEHKRAAAWTWTGLTACQQLKKMGQLHDFDQGGKMKLNFRINHALTKLPYGTSYLHTFIQLLRGSETSPHPRSSPFMLIWQWCLQIFSRRTNQAVMPSVTLNNADKKMLFCSKTREQTKGKHEIFLKLKERCRSQFSIVPAQEACFSSTSCSNKKARLPFLHYQGACLAAVQSPQHIRECVTIAIFWHTEEKLECFYMRKLFLRLRNESTPGHIFIEHIKKRKFTQSSCAHCNARKEYFSQKTVYLNQSQRSAWKKQPRRK